MVVLNRTVNPYNESGREGVSTTQVETRIENDSTYWSPDILSILKKPAIRMDAKTNQLKSKK